jgi:hypothetical protein
MKDRLLTIAGGLLAFVLVVVLLVPVQRDESDRISRPLSTDRGRAGLQGLARWLEEGRVPTDALRRRYAALSASLDLSPRGNLLIISLPQRKPSRLDERQALRRWLAQGNNALVLVAAGDTPRWVATSAGSTTGGFLESFGFEFDAERDEGAEQGETEEGEAEEGEAEEVAEGSDRADSPPGSNLSEWLEAERVALVPRFRHPLTQGVASVATQSVRALDRGWSLTGADDGRAVLPLLAETGKGAAFWEVRVGAGRMWVSRYSNLFANAGLGEADNARFMANLISASLGRNGRVIFDDMHQGASDLYDPEAFFSDPRLVNTLIFMVAFWLLYLVGRSRRLAPAREAVSRYYAADLGRAMGGFFARRLSPSTLEQQLFVFFFNDIRSRYGLPTNGQPLWSMLSGISRVPVDDVNSLRRHFERAAAGRKPDPVALARLMQRTRENLI